MTNGSDTVPWLLSCCQCQQMLLCAGLICSLQQTGVPRHLQLWMARGMAAAGQAVWSLLTPCLLGLQAKAR